MLKYILVFILGILVGYFASYKTKPDDTSKKATAENNTTQNSEYEYILYSEKSELKNILNSLVKDCVSRQNSFFTVTIKDKNETYNLKIDTNHSDFTDKYSNLNAIYAECKETNSSVKYRFLSHREQILNK